MPQINLGKVVGDGSYFDYTHSKSGTTHQLVGPSGAAAIKFVASDDYAYRDTFLVNSSTYVAKQTNGQPLPTGYFVEGSVVSCFLNSGTLFFDNGGEALNIFYTMSAPPTESDGIYFQPINNVTGIDFQSSVDIRSHTRYTNTPFPIATSQGGTRIAVLDDELFVAHGTAAATAYFVIYNTKTDTWRNSTTTTYPIGYGNFVTIGREIWGVGGHSSPHPRIQIYDVDTDTWRLGPQFPINMFGGLISYNEETNIIYAGGGYNTALLNAFYKLDLKATTPAWVTVGANVPDTGSYRSGYATYGDILYSYGGSGTNKLLRQFNMSTETWLPSVSPTPMVAEQDIGIYVTGDDLYITHGSVAAEAVQLKKYNMATGVIETETTVTGKLNQFLGDPTLPKIGNCLYIPTGNTVSDRFLQFAVENRMTLKNDAIYIEYNEVGYSVTLYTRGNTTQELNVVKVYQCIDGVLTEIPTWVRNSNSSWIQIGG